MKNRVEKKDFSFFYEDFLKNYYRTSSFNDARRIVNLLEQIDNIYNKIRTHREYDYKLKRERIKSIDKDANRHSVMLEEGIKRYNSEEKKILINNLLNANLLLKKEGINKTTISMLGNIIDPISNPYQTFRNKLVKFGDFYPPSNLESILSNLDYFFYIVDDKRIHPILKSNEAHIELIKIHPYNDGNGRAARLIQNYILKKHKYPPISIDIKERDLYIQLMEKALERRYNENTNIYNLTSEEVSLYLFFTTKMLENITEIKKELDKRRLYKIRINVKENNDIYSVMKSLKSRLKHKNKNLTIKYIRKDKFYDGAFLEVVGDIKRSTIEKTIKETLRYRKNFRYEFI